MTGLRRYAVLLGGSALLWSSLASAQTAAAPPPAASAAPAATPASQPPPVPELAPRAEPPGAQPPAAPAPGVAPAGASPGGADDVHARRVLTAVAGQERSARMAGGVALLVVGATLVVTGVVAEAQFDDEYGSVLWITGAVLGGASILTFVVKGPVESLQDETASMSAAERKGAWSAKASSARTARQIGSVVGIGLGVASVGTGVAIASGAGDLQEDAQEAWTIVLLAAGGSLIGTGIAGLLMESPLETGYRAAYGSDSARAPALSLGVGAARRGATLTLRGAF